jgi:hypothetical protein
MNIRATSTTMQVPRTCQDMGFRCDHGDRSCNDPALVQLTRDYQRNMAALRNATLNAGKFVSAGAAAAAYE